MSTFMQIDDREFKAALLRFYASQKKSWPEVIKSQARLICVNLAFQTAPYGKDKSVRDKSQRTVKGEIGRVYKEVGTIAFDVKNSGKTFSTSDWKQRGIGRATGEITTSSKAATSAQAAAAFVRLMRAGQYDKASELLKSLNLHPFQYARVGRFDGGLEHKKARFGGRQKVPKNQLPRLGATNFNNIRSYINKIKERVGIAKGGWAACAARLGGFRDIPAWVYNQAKQRSLGGVEDFTAGKNPHVIMTNSVPWIDKCLSQGQMQKAIDIQKQKMIDAIGQSMTRSARAMGF